jgi:hypothetical protein
MDAPPQGIKAGLYRGDGVEAKGMADAGREAVEANPVKPLLKEHPYILLLIQHVV